MKTHNRPLSPDLPEDIRKYLETVPPLSQEDLAELRAAAGELDSDPAFQAEYLKGLFIEKMFEALEDRHETQSEFARRWGKTRQYVSKLFHESKRVNFTIETLCDMAHQFGLRVDLRVLRPNEVAQMMSCVASERTLISPEARWGEAPPPPSRLQ